MTQSPFFVAVAIITALFGLGFLLIPDGVLSLYGAATDEAGRLTGRFFGSALIGLAIIYFVAPDMAGGTVLTGLLWAGLIINALDLVLALIGTTGGVLNAVGWASVVLHILLGAGFAYLLFARPAAA